MAKVAKAPPPPPDPEPLEYEEPEYDHPGATGEYAQIIVYLAMLLYVYGFAGCRIFCWKFVVRVAIVLQLIKLFLILGGILPCLLHCIADALYPNMRNDLFPGMILLLLILAVLLSLLVPLIWRCLYCGDCFCKVCKSYDCRCGRKKAWYRRGRNKPRRWRKSSWKSR